jgi:hypothetical protein
MEQMRSARARLLGKRREALPDCLRAGSRLEVPSSLSLPRREFLIPDEAEIFFARGGHLDSTSKLPGPHFRLYSCPSARFGSSAGFLVSDFTLLGFLIGVSLQSDGY